MIYYYVFLTCEESSVDLVDRFLLDIVMLEWATLECSL